MRTFALLAPRRALAAEPFEPPAKQRRPSPREPAVRLELRLAGAPRADAAAEPLEVLPHAAHAREVVLELRELDLELSLGRHRVLREDVEDQLGAVDDARLQRVFEHPLLRRGELVVDEQHLRPRPLVLALQLLELALADVRAAVRLRAVLHEPVDRLDARGPRELGELGELVLGVGARAEAPRRRTPALLRLRVRDRAGARSRA